MRLPLDRGWKSGRSSELPVGWDGALRSGSALFRFPFPPGRYPLHVAPRTSELCLSKTPYPIDQEKYLTQYFKPPTKLGGSLITDNWNDLLTPDCTSPIRRLPYLTPNNKATVAIFYEIGMIKKNGLRNPALLGVMFLERCYNPRYKNNLWLMTYYLWLP